MKAALQTWLASARPNDSYCYHTGANLHIPASDDAVVALVRKLYDDGHIELFQRRVGPSKFDFLAVKRGTQAKRAPYFGNMRQAPLAA